MADVTTKNRYPRLKGFDYTAQRSYFVTFVVRDRRAIFIEPRAAQGVVRAAMLYRTRGWYWLYGYCVMPDHVHLVLRPQSKNRSLATIVGHLKRAASHYCRQGGFVFTWQDGFHDRIVREYETSAEMVEYVLLNPVRAGLVSDFAAYPYSGRVDSIR
jgi:REP element-mobilizing transposase RayT